MTGRTRLLAGAISVGLVGGALVAGGAVSADVAPKPSEDARVPVVKSAAVASGAGAPASGKVSIKGQYQATNYYCVPASSSVSLATLGVGVSQQNLAKQMKTTASGGTSGKNALPVLNKYALGKGYTYDWADVSSGTKMLNAVAHDVGVLKRATVLGVWMEQLPWNKGKVSGSKIGHAIVVYGYDTAKKTVTVWDPWKATGGTHTIAASTLASVAQTNGLYYLTAHRDVDLTNVGDVTGDGTADAAAVDRADGKLYLYQGPKFAISGRKVLDGRNWSGMTQVTGVGDVNGDGRTDVVAVGPSGSLRLYHGTADGLDDGAVIDDRNWNSVTQLTAVGDPGAKTKRTLTAVSKSSGTLYRFPWTGAKTLGTGQKLDTRDWNTVKELTAIGDLNGDGRAGDLLAIGRKSGYLYLFPQTVSGYATGKKLGENWANDRSLTGTGDVDDNGHPDLAMIRNSDGDMFLYGGVNGTFGPTQNVGTGWNG